MIGITFGGCIRLYVTRNILGALLFLAGLSPAVARQVSYANTCVEQESGDVAGYVVTFSDDGPLPVISLSWSEGALMAPVQAIITGYDRKSGRLSFSVKTEAGEFVFKGKVEPHVIEGDLLSPFGPPKQVKLEKSSPKLANSPKVECKS
jgi:hypothetical protein